MMVERIPPTSIARLMKAKYSATQTMATLISVGSLSAIHMRAANSICTGRLSVAGHDDGGVRDEARPCAQEACGGGACDVND